MLKNDTLKNGTSRIGLYGSAPPPAETMAQPSTGLTNILRRQLVVYKPALLIHAPLGNLLCTLHGIGIKGFC